MSGSGAAYVATPDGILGAIRALIDAARESIVLQMYLFAADGHLIDLDPRPGAPPHARTIAGWLIDRRRRDPDLPIVLVLDTNTPDDPARVRVPGDLVRHELARAGVIVLNANLFGTRFDRRRRFPSAARFDRRWQADGVGADTWVARQRRWQFWHTVEDHRKNLVIDGGRRAAITSHNFIDAAADWHENLLLVDGDAAGAVGDLARAALQDALAIPQAIDAAQRATVARLAAAPGPTTAPALPPAPVEVLDTLAIRPAIEAAIAASGAGDAIAVASTYCSDVPILEALHAAAVRGARVRLLFDDLAGLPLSGASRVLVRELVNHRAVEAAARLAHPRFEVRVHPSGDGRMMHLKTAAFTGAARALLIAGQANYTPNSFSGAWLETDLAIESPAIAGAFLAQYEPLWAASRPVPRRSWQAAPRSLARRGLLAAFAALGLAP